ncbi:MAG: FG-GAP-like repeat-containing protein [bacterium]
MKKKLHALILTVFITSISFAQIDFEPIATAGLPLVSQGSSSFADVDNDGDIDIFISGNNAGTYIAHIYLNNGNGEFTLSTNSLEGATISASEFLDVDNDNDQDLIYFGFDNSFNRIIKLYTNNGSGIFTEDTNSTFTGMNSGDIAVADVDGDNDTDILISGEIGSVGTTELYLNDGNGVFTETSTSLQDVAASTIAFADLDNDNDEDLVLLGFNANIFYGIVYVNDGLGNFTVYTNANIQGVAFGAISVEDFDNDGFKDLVVSGRIDNTFARSTTFYLNNGDATFSINNTSNMEGVEDGSIGSLDANNDGLLDIIVTGISTTDSSLTRLYYGNGANGFSNSNIPFFTNIYNGSHELIADLDGDSDDDVVILGSDFNTAAVTATAYRNIPLDNTSHPDYSALEAIYNATQGAFWNTNFGWLSSDVPIAYWHGISVISSNNRVRRLDLNTNNLIGTLPSDIGSIEFLDFLDLRSNFISGTLPESLGDLQNITWIDFRFNQFSGTIPESITTIPGLFVFVVSNNNLSGPIPDFTTQVNANLDFLWFENNQFVFADFEDQFSTYVNAVGSGFVFAPQQFIDIPQGEAGNLGEIITLSPSLDLNTLGTNLTVDWYTGDTFEFLGTGETFDITINSESDYRPYLYFVTSSVVTGLGLQSENITVGPSPTTHPDYDALLALYNALDGPNWDIPWDITAPIETWDAVNAPFDPIIFDPVSNRITSITLNGQDRVGQIPAEIGDFDALTYLNLGSFNITGSIPTEIGNLTNLTELWLFGCDLSGEVPSEIWTLTNLRNLLLGSQSNAQLTLTNGIPAEISNLTQLEWLNLNSIPLTLPLEPELYNLPNLIRLRVQDCGLEGELPAGFANISDIFADRNNMSGVIPQEILDVTNNNRLSITNNYFDFTDLEPLAMTNGYTFLDYSPQRTLDEPEDIAEAPGSDITLTITDDNIGREAENNVYQWFKDDVIIVGADQDTYTIFNAQESDSGVYYCEITNPLLPDLTIRRAEINLTIDETLTVDSQVVNEINVYPNPVIDILNIKITTNSGQGKLYDVAGKMIWEGSLTNSTKIDLSSLPSGVYFLQLKTTLGSESKRIVKK